MDIKFGIVTCSSTRSIDEDTAGARLEELIAEQGWTTLSCGGSGLSLADVTPEATRKVCDREVPGIAEAMRAYSMTKTHRAMLSRAIAAQRGRVLVVNLPGSKKAAEENWEGVYDQFDHAVSMMAGEGHA